jgi:molybdopterin-guanine dinucleotide biosynthesis protein B
LTVAQPRSGSGRSESGRAVTPVIGVVGWKNAGKTTLVERLVAELVRRGWRVATVKHAHHDAEIDQPGRDSWRHRAAGAHEVALVTGRRWAIMHEARDAAPTLGEVIARLGPADVVLVEGFKNEPHPKIEVRAATADRPGEDIAPGDPNVVAIAADRQPANSTLPWFRRDDVAGLADFIAARADLR